MGIAERERGPAVRDDEAMQSIVEEARAALGPVPSAKPVGIFAAHVGVAEIFGAPREA